MKIRGVFESNRSRFTHNKSIYIEILAYMARILFKLVQILKSVNLFPLYTERFPELERLICLDMHIT